MPKYRNTQQFVQPLTVNGKRIIVRPGEVVQLDKEIDLSFAAFLELVPDETPVSKVSTVKSAAKPINSTLEQLKSDVEATKSAVGNHASKDDLNNHVETTKTELAKIHKRMEVLKKAVDTLNQALSNMEQIVYNNENFVIEEEK